MSPIPLDDTPIYRAMSDEKFRELLARNDPRPMDERTPRVNGGLPFVIVVLALIVAAVLAAAAVSALNGSVVAGFFVLGAIVAAIWAGNRGKR